MMVARFDLDDPPADPPEGADPLVWRMAHALREAHQPDSTACCVTCPYSEPWPCRPSKLAASGYRLALRLAQSTGPRWAGHNQRIPW